ncbi:unnamed protein product [Hymenolepis diminuta]|uniref:Secreted protein n=1 Tax=Hymenolepis diminuta TaxID=6216 RepID=A0A0R3SCS0_HYMDI|nr:unnamed protein product [Hymenolepis diminuta]VUZ49486.1 unnamed protein product [Hymenolepis diminuta]
MHLLEICTVLALLTYVDSVPVKDLDPDLGETDRTVYTGTFSNGGSGKLTAKWCLVRHHFIRCNNTTEAPGHSALNTGASETLATVAESTEFTASSEETTGHVTWESSQELGTGATQSTSLHTRTTFSPLKVHYDDYNYPVLAP